MCLSLRIMCGVLQANSTTWQTVIVPRLTCERQHGVTGGATIQTDEKYKDERVVQTKTEETSLAAVIC